MRVTNCTGTFSLGSSGGHQDDIIPKGVCVVERSGGRCPQILRDMPDMC